MTQIEDRVRRAFGAETTGLAPTDDLADTVITRGHRIRRVRRAGAGAAVAAAVALALLIPIGILSSADAPLDPSTPAESPQTDPTTNLENLPQGTPPKVLYAENVGTEGLLHDGEQQASLNTGQAITPVARVGRSWLVVVTVAADGTEPPATRGDLALMSPGGHEPVWFSSGVEPGQVTVSPDGSQAAFVRHNAESPRELVVIDLLTETIGTQRGRRPMGSDGRLLGWNPDGIWLRTGSTTSIWRPGLPARPVQFSPNRIKIYRQTRRVVVIDDSPSRCVGVSVPHLNGYISRWQKCRSEGYHDAELSPDGRYVVLPDGETAPVEGGASRRTMPLDGPGSAVWEDNTHLLVRTVSVNDGLLRTIVVRCDIRAQRCERAYDRTVRRDGVSSWLTLAQP